MAVWCQCPGHCQSSVWYKCLGLSGSIVAGVSVQAIVSQVSGISVEANGSLVSGPLLAKCLVLVARPGQSVSRLLRCQSSVISVQANDSLVSGVNVPKKYLRNIFLISQPKHMLWVLKRTVSLRRFF